MGTWLFEPGHTAAMVSRAAHDGHVHVRGHFKNVSGSLVFDPENPAQSSADVAIDAAARTSAALILGFRWSGFKSPLTDQLEPISANLALRSLNASLSFLADSQLRTRRRHAHVHDRGAFAENGYVENAGIEKGAVADAGLLADCSRSLVSLPV